VGDIAARLLIISRDLLIDVSERPSGDFVFRQLANLNRRGLHLLLTAAAPDNWVPTRGSVDDALKTQANIKEKIQVAGGDIDGVYYIARSLLTQDRNRKGALLDILRRYGLEPEEACLLSGSKPFIKVAAGLGVATLDVTASAKGVSQLVESVKPYINQGAVD
jgi:hypothetical protein